MRNSGLDESQAEIKIFGRNINNLKYAGERHWHPTPVLLPGKSHGRRSPVGCSPWGQKESNTTEQLHFHFSLSCIGEGNGNPLQRSCLENPRDGVAQSRTRLNRLSSSSSYSRTTPGGDGSVTLIPLIRPPIYSFILFFSTY